MGNAKWCSDYFTASRWTCAMCHMCRTAVWICSSKFDATLCLDNILSLHDSPGMMLAMTSRRSQITLQPGVLKWSRVRAGISSSELARKMQVRAERVMEWEETGRISIAQVDRLAEKTYTPFGFLYLDEPPDETLPISDFRTVGDEHPRKPSPKPVGNRVCHASGVRIGYVTS